MLPNYIFPTYPYWSERIGPQGGHMWGLQRGYGHTRCIALRSVPSVLAAHLLLCGVIPEPDVDGDACYRSRFANGSEIHIIQGSRNNGDSLKV